MHIIKINATSVAADTDGLATAAICTGAGPWVPDVDTAITGSSGVANLITITQISGTNHSGKTAEIIGTDINDIAQTEVIAALPNGAVTVTGTKYFKTVTSGEPSATIGADTMTMGWAADSVTPWTNVTGQGVLANIGIGCTVVSGSPTYTMQYTYDAIAVFDHSSITDRSSDASTEQMFPVEAVRLAFTAAGTVNLRGLSV